MKLSKGFITTPNGELEITVEDADLNAPVVQQQEEEGRSPRGGTQRVTYRIPASCPGTTLSVAALNGCNTGYGPSNVFRFRTAKGRIFSGSPKDLYSGNFGTSPALPESVVGDLVSDDNDPSVDFQDVVLTVNNWSGLHATTQNAWKELTSESAPIAAARQEWTDDGDADTDPDDIPDTFRHPYALENPAGGAFIIRSLNDGTSRPTDTVEFAQDIEFTVTYLAADVQTAEVSLTSTTDNRGVKMLLEETGADTGKFERTFKTMTAPQTTHIVDLKPGVIESEINLNLDGMKANGDQSERSGTVDTASHRTKNPGLDITGAEASMTSEANIGIDLNGDGDYTATTTWIDLRIARRATIPPSARLGWLMNSAPSEGDDVQATLCTDSGGAVDDGNDRQLLPVGVAPADFDVGDLEDEDKLRICWTDTTMSMPAIAAAPGALITVAYDDGGTRRVANATVETTKPTIRVTSPGHNTATRVTSARLIAEITDADSGVDLSKTGEIFDYITFNVEATNLAGGSVAVTGGFDDVNAEQVTTVSIAGGVRAEATLRGVPSGETLITWSVTAQDIAGNVATSDQNPADGPVTMDDPDTDENEAEAAGANKVEPDRYELRIDTVAPQLGVVSIDYDGSGSADDKTVDGAITGNYLDDDNNVVTDATKARNTSVRMVFNEDIKADTVQQDDFRVNGAAPVAVAVKDESVYLTVPAMASDARPDVRLSGPIDDLAGNTRQGGLRVEQAQDGISPTIEVSVNPDYHQSEVSIEVSSNEALLTAPIIRLSKDGQDDTAEAPGRGVTGLSSATLVGSDLYRATFKAPVQPFAYNVNVDVLDTSANPRSLGKSKADDDGATTIEIDKSLPAQTSVTLPGQAAITSIDTDKTYKVTTRNPFITIEWDSEGKEYGRITDSKDTDTKSDDTAILTNDAADIAAVADNDDLSFKSLDTHGTVDFTNLKIKVADETYDVDTPTGDESGARTEVVIDEDTTYVFNLTKPTKNRLLIAARGLELGDYELSFNGQDELGNTRKSDVKIKFEIKDPDPFEVKLTPGWNLISFPSTPQMTGINDVIPADHPATVVLTYDPTEAGGWLSAQRGEDGMFTGTLSEITGGVGYWIFTDSFQSFKVQVRASAGGDPVTLPTVNLVQGWNLIPVLDVTGGLNFGANRSTLKVYIGSNATRAYQYDGSTNRYTVIEPEGDVLKVGTGYWVYMSSATVLVP